MRHTTDTLPDRSTRISHTLRSQETWYGVLIRQQDTKQLATIKKDLDKILENHGQVLSVNEKDYLYCKGTYSPDVLADIKRYVHGINNSKTVILEGRYEDFLGFYWLRQSIRHKL